VAAFVDTIRATLAELLGADAAPTPYLPEALPPAARPLASEAVDLLIAYQGPAYAQLYLDRLNRFIGKRNVDDALLCEIARLMAMRMCYDDPIRMAQLALAEPRLPRGAKARGEIRRLRLEELAGALPAIIGEPLLDALQWLGWQHRRIPLRFAARGWIGVRMLKLCAGLRRWRPLSIRYDKERAWVERWLHMIDRSLTKQPAAAAAVAQTATMVRGHGESYRQNLADWNLIIDRLAKPTFDGVLELPDLAAAVAQARAAALPDPRQAALQREIAAIRANAAAAPQHQPLPI
jgi:hypothetical protein